MFFPALIFSTLKDQTEFVYHYTRAEAAINWILPSRRLKLGAYAKTNDPKEVKQWTFGLGNVPLQADHVSIDEISARVSSAIKQQAHVFCAGVDTGLVEGAGYEIHCRGFARPRMWDQYGDKHKGVCLIFRRARLDKLFIDQHSDMTVHGGRVKYHDRSPFLDLRVDHPYLIDYPRLLRVGVQQYAIEHLHRHLGHFFFEKATDWRDEHEHRWLVVSSASDDIYLSYEDALAGVVFGEDCPADHVRQCVRLARRPGTDFEQLKWKNSAPMLSVRDDWPNL